MSDALHDVTGDFLSGHARADTGNAVANLDALLQNKPGGGSAPAPAAPVSAAVTPAAASPGAAPQADDQVPFGTRILNAVKAAPAAAVKQFAGDIEGTWNQLKTDYLASVPDAAKYQKAGFWDATKMQFQQQLSAGKSVADAFNLVMSPISSALDVASTGVGEGAHAAVPAIHAKALKGAIDASLAGIGPEGGPLSAAVKAGKVAETVAGVTKAAEGGAEAAAGAAAKPEAAAPKRDFMFAGQPADAAGRLRVTDADKTKATDYLTGKIPNNPVQASLAMLSDQSGAQEVITKIAKFIPPGAVKSDDVMMMGAYSLQRTPEEILSGLKTVLPSDEEVAAWKMTMDAAGQEVKSHADAWAADPTPENFDKFTNAFTLGLKITKDWDEAGTAQGRAFRARQLDTGAQGGGIADFSKNIREILTNIGPDNIEEALHKITALEDPAKIPAWLSLLRRMKSRDALTFGWTNILLSNVPKTLSKKLFGDGFAAAWQVATHGMAEAGGAVPSGSTHQLLYGYLGSFGDAFRAAGKALRQGGSQFHADYQTVEGTEKLRASELAKGMDGQRVNSPTNAAIAYLRAALPTTWIGAADDFAKVFHQRAGARMLAYMDAAKKSSPELAASHISDLMNNMPPALYEQSISYAVKNAFQEPLTGIASDLAAAIDKANIPIAGTGTALPFGRAIMPFIKIPVNLDRFAYRASPLPMAFPTDALRAELNAGGSRAALAKAGVGLGSAFSMIALTLAASDRLTGMGPSEPDERRFWLDGHQPYSVKVGGKWYGYQGAHPLGLMLAPVADTADIFRFAHDRDAEDAALSLAFGIGHALLAPTFMMGASDFLEAINDPSQDGRYFFDNLAANIGAPQGEAAIANAMDPWKRAHYGAIEAVKARTPGLSTSLPPSRTIWGDPIPRTAGWIPGLGDGTGLGRAISPVPVKDADGGQPIDKWIWDNRAAFPRGDEGRLGMTPPGRAFSWDGGTGVSAHVQLDPQQLDRLKVLAGNALKDPMTKLGARDALNALVQGKFPQAATQGQFDKGSPELRAMIVQRMWGQYRAGANKALMAEDGRLRDIVSGQLGMRKDQLTKSGTPAMPQLGARP